MFENFVQLLVTGLSIIVAILCIRYRSIKEADKIKHKVQSIIKGGLKTNIYLSVMIVSCMAISGLLIIIYKDNSIIFNIKRIILICLLWIAAYYDYKYMRIPNRLILIGVVWRIIIFIFELVFERNNLFTTVKSEILAAGILVVASIICMIIIKNSIGMGDVKLFTIMGLFQGINGITYSVFLSLLVSFFVALFLLAKKKKGRKDAIPFAPCILVGTMISVFLIGM
ncbi:MAG: prepilin peptidase [Eubacterium sp.]